MIAASPVATRESREAAALRHDRAKDDHGQRVNREDRERYATVNERPVDRDFDVEEPTANDAQRQADRQRQG